MLIKWNRIFANTRLFFWIVLQVYEHITFNNEKHISLASFPGMKERTIITSSISKTFSVTGKAYMHLAQKTFDWICLCMLVDIALRNFDSKLLESCLLGWRVGWAIAPAFIASAIRNIHAKLTDSAPAPFQEATLVAFGSPPEYFESLRSVRSKRHY